MNKKILGMVIFWRESCEDDHNCDTCPSGDDCESAWAKIKKKHRRKFKALDKAFKKMMEK